MRQSFRRRWKREDKRILKLRLCSIRVVVAAVVVVVVVTDAATLSVRPFNAFVP